MKKPPRLRNRSNAFNVAMLAFCLSATSVVAAADENTLSGVVLDSSGMPVRGAIVKVPANPGKLIARYTQTDGRYDIRGLSPGSHDVTVEAFGFAPMTLRADGASLNFKLTPNLQATHFTSAELRYLFPEQDREALRTYYSCADCHDLDTVLPRTGMPAAAWAGFIPYMTIHRWGPALFPAQYAAAIAPAVEHVFGPQGLLGPSAKPDYTKIKHTPLTDAALKATIVEYVVPSEGSQPHSVRVDRRSDTVWFASYDAASNNIFQFDPSTERFTAYKIPLPRAEAHTGTVLKDGSYLVALDAREGSPTKLAMATPPGKMTTFDWKGRSSGARVAVLDPTNSDVVWLVAGPETWRFNVKTKEFRAYQNPTPSALPEGSHAEAYAFPGEKPLPDGYDLTVDSKGIPWVSQLQQGIIFRLDPESGATKLYHTSEMRSARGVVADAKDNIWYADYFGHKLGVLDTKTGTVRVYQPPNPYAAPYGLSLDPKRGHVWYADTTSNNVTRFDPKTGEFVEYPLPTKSAAARFPSVDSKGRAWYGGFWNQRLGMVDPGDEDARRPASSTTR